MLPTDIWVPFADGEYRFALLLPQQMELEKTCGFNDAQGAHRRKGIIELYGDIIAGMGLRDGEIVVNPLEGMASAFDCREVVRLALVGGAQAVIAGEEKAISAVRARQLVETYIDTAPIVERWKLAGKILRAAVEGYDPPKKDEPVPAPAKPKRTRTKASASTT